MRDLKGLNEFKISGGHRDEPAEYGVVTPAPTAFTRNRNDRVGDPPPSALFFRLASPA